MKKLSIREAVFGGLLVLVPLLMFVLVIKPRYDAQKKMSKMASDIYSTCGEFKDIRPVAIKRLRADKKALRKLLKDTRRRLPKDGGFGGILHGLAKMAQENNLTLKDVEPVSRGPKQDAEVSHDGYDAQRIDIELEGNFKGLYDFLIALESYQRVILIDKMDLKLTGIRSGDGDKASDSLIDAELGLVVYYKKTSEKCETSND